MILVLFTATYPYTTGGERNFVEPELSHLAEAFERVVIVPERRAEPSASTAPAVEVVDSYAERMRSASGAETFLRGILSPQTYREISARPSLLVRPAYLKRLLYFVGQAELTRAWVEGWLSGQGLSAQHCLFYTFWFDQAALGIGLARRGYPGLNLVSRTHRYDLYEELRSPPYWPCREAALEGTDRLFSVSDAGAEYLCEKYPQYSGRIATARLGVVDHGFVTGSSADGIYRIVSCSRVAPVKRLGLILDSIRAAALRRPEARFEWRHFGRGELGSLTEQRQRLPSNLSVDFIEYSSQADLFAYYRDHPVDLFVNLSASEGIPVSIMEAISCGIPVLATAVGGNTEVVTTQNGLLVDADASPDQIADALLEHLDHPGNRRQGSRQVWVQRYDADRNAARFAEQLVAIRKQG